MWTIILNDSCSKCAGVSEILDQQGIAWTPVRYLQGELTQELLEAVFAGYGGPTSDLIRQNEPAWLQSGLDMATMDLADLKQFVLDHPAVLQRPIVLKGRDVVVARPPQRIWELIGVDE